MAKLTRIAAIILVAAYLALLFTPLSPTAVAQQDRPPRLYSTDPVNPCSVITGMWQNWSTGTIWACVGSPGVNNGRWIAISSSGVTVPPYVSVPDFDFAAQSPGGVLTAGVPATITLRPVPIGVNGTNTDYRMYLSTCTGGVHAVLITGGSAVSGAASGTVTFTPTNSCGAGWKIKSASAGWGEAIWAVGPSYINGDGPKQRSIFAPCGGYLTYAPITVPVDRSPEIYGSGACSTIYAQFASGDVFSYKAGTTIAAVSFHDLRIYSSVVRTSGWMLAVRGMNAGTVFNVTTVLGYDGIVIEGGTGIHTDNLAVLNFADLGIYRHATAQFSAQDSNWFVSGTAGCAAAFKTQVESGAAIAGYQLTNASFQSCSYNWYLNAIGPANEITVTNLVLDGSTVKGLDALGTGGTNRFVLNGGSSLTGQGSSVIDFENSHWSNIVLDDFSCDTSGAAGTCVLLEGVQHASVSHFSIPGSGLGTPDDRGIVIKQDSADGVTPTDGVTIGPGAVGFNGGLGASTIGLLISANAHTNLTVVGGTSVYGATPISDGNLSPTRYTGYVLGMHSVAHSVASAATLAFPHIGMGDQLVITGTTGVTAVSGLYEGQSGTLLTTDGAVAFTAGTTIGVSKTTSQNVAVGFTFKNSKLWLQ